MAQNAERLLCIPETEPPCSILCKWSHRCAQCVLQVLKAIELHRTVEKNYWFIVLIARLQVLEYL
jgi:hypothetical protein